MPKSSSRDIFAHDHYSLQRFATVRNLRALALPAFLFAASASNVALDPFIASGAYLASTRTLADCNIAFIPAMDRQDSLAAAAPLSPFHFATYRAGQDLAYTYRMAAPSSGVLQEIPDAIRDENGSREVPALSAVHRPAVNRVSTAAMGMRHEDAMGRARVFQFTDYLDNVTTVTNTVAGSSCTRIAIKTPGIIQVGVDGSSGDSRTAWVVGTMKFLDLYRSSGKLKANGYPEGSDAPPETTPGSRTNEVGVPAINPDTMQPALAWVRVYRDMQPAPGEKISLWVDGRGAPNTALGFTTIPHDHLIFRGGQNIPWKAGTVTILSSGAWRSPGPGFGAPPVILTTDNSPGTLGQAQFQFRAKYRGGPERFVAKMQSDPNGVAGQQNVMVAMLEGRPYVDLMSTSTCEKRPCPASDAFPFIMTGSNVGVHSRNHFMRRDAMEQLRGALKGVWYNDIKQRQPKEEHYWMVNDMSLEYGGRFKIGDGLARSNDERTNDGPHATHNVGLDADVVPCYSQGPLTTTTGMNCLMTSSVGRGSTPRIDEAILAQWVIGRYNGAILEHHQSEADLGRAMPGRGVKIDGAPPHYHIRIGVPRTLRTGGVE